MHPGHLVLSVLLFAGLFALTRHRELQEDPARWWRLAASVPFVHALAGLALFTFGIPISPIIAYFGIISTLALAIIWREYFAYFGARKAENVMYGDGRGGGGFVPEFGHARGLMKDENWREAIVEIEGQLKKDPHNFEAHRLLISCHLDLEEPELALTKARLLQSFFFLTDEQRDWAHGAVIQLEEAVEAKEKARRNQH